MSEQTYAVVSVVIPIWNAQNYLENCVDSVLRQSYPSIELILVDDGSADASGEICDRYAQKYPFVRVIHKQNGGASSARNAGLQAAGGEYIVFVDSDDSISENCISRLAETSVSTGAEYVKSRFIYSGRESEAQTETIDLSDASRFLPFLRKVFTSCGTLYRLDILREHNVLFDETLKCSEDAVFLRQYFRYCSKAATLSDAYYYCTDNAHSVSKRFYADYALYHRKKLDMLAELFETLNYPQNTSSSFLCERAFWGFKNTIVHGKKHALGSEEFRSYMERSVDALYPYLMLDAPIAQRSVDMWRKMYFRSIRNRDIDRLCRIAAAESAYQSLLGKMKTPVKKLLRRT